MGNVGIALGGGKAFKMPVAAVIALLMLGIYGVVKFNEANKR